MQNKTAGYQPLVNPNHRRQVFWQIWLPLGLTALLVITSAVLAVVMSTGSTRPTTGQLAAISTIWIILPLIPAGLIFLLFTIGLIYLTARALKIVPVYSRLAQIYIQIIGVKVSNLMDRLAKPLIQLGGSTAGWKAVWRRPRQ